MFLLFERIMLTPKQRALTPRSFDVIGDILIFSDFPQELVKKEKEIGKYLLQKFKHIKVIAKKTHFHSGRYRTKKIKIIAGEKRKTTLHKESGVTLKVDVEKCYFSPRLSNERLRIAKQVKKGEEILVPFSGICVYPLIIAKHAQPKEIVAIELNPLAHHYALENIFLNKARTIQCLKGDVEKILPKINKKFDRIIIPLPSDAQNYLELVTKKLKKKGILHFYTFLKKEDIEEKKKIAQRFPQFTLLKIIKCGPFSPSTYRVCIDLRLK